MSHIEQQKQTANILLNVEAQTSSLAHILQTNDPPSDLELKQISPFLHTVETEIARFAAQDVDPNTKKATVHEPLAVLRATLRGAVFPLRRVPSEILSQIFSECMFYDLNDDEQTSWNTLNVTRPPWSLAQVSQRWRETALADQMLWSCIRVDSWAVAAAGQPEPTVPRLVACLARSGQQPLSIHLTELYPSLFNTKPLFIQLLAYAERWTYLKLVVSFEYLVHTIPLKGRLPQLKKLVIEADGLNTFGIFDAFELAPKLRTASITVDEPYGHPPGPIIITSHVPYVIKLPWGQLTSLEVDSLEVVKYTPQLLHCRLIITSSTNLPTDKAVIQHTSMRIHITDVTSVLDRLETPALESLHVLSSNEPGVLSQIVSFLFRSSCTLKTLTLSGTIIVRESELRLLLQHVPGLLSFEIDHHKFVMWNTVARALTITAQSHLVPKLEKIIFIFSKLPPYRCDIDPEILLCMLESRRNVSNHEDVEQLQSVALIGTPSTLLAQLMPHLLTLKKLGLKITHDRTG